MEEKKSIKSNALLNVIRMASNMLFPMLIFPYISRVLGPESVGKVNFTISVINYFVLIASMGISTYGVLICAKVRNDLPKLKKVICELLYINIFLTFVAYALFFILLAFVPQFVQYRGLFLLNSLTIFFTVIGIEWLYTALEEFRYITIRSIIFRIISLPLTFVFVRSSDDFYQYAIVLLVSSVGANVLNFIQARKYLKFYPLHELNVRRHWKPILVFFSASVAATINGNTDSLMLGLFSGDAAVGFYTFSVKIKTLLTSVITAALSVSTPRFALYAVQKKFDEYRTLLRKCVLVTLSIAFSISIFFIFFSRETILILGGKEYLNAMPSVIVLTLCVIVLGMTWVLGVGVLQPLGRETAYAKVMFIACGINIVLNTLLIPVLNVTGASIATFATEFCNMLLFYYAARDFLQDTFKKVGIWKMAVIAVAAGAITYTITQHIEIHVLFLIAIEFTVFSLIYWGALLLLHREFRVLIWNVLGVMIKKITEK